MGSVAADLVGSATETSLGQHWQPLLVGDRATSTLEAVAEIAEHLQRIAADPEAELTPLCWFPLGGRCSLGSGWAGFSLFFSYLHQTFSSRGRDETAIGLLERSLDEVNQEVLAPGLFAGLPGIAWALEHIGKFVDTEESDLGADVATALLSHLRRSPWTGDLSLHHGLVGFGVYALERGSKPGGVECLERTIAHLVANGTRDSDGIAWWTRPEHLLLSQKDRFPKGQVNLGVALGAPGIIALLAEAMGAGLDTKAILEDAISWLFRRRLPEGSLSVFPYTYVPGHTPSGTQIAWCYGDLGISVCLLNAARRLRSLPLESKAVDIARVAAMRPLASIAVPDAGMCHGAAGIAHLFNRVFQATSDPLFRECALAWFDQILEMAQPKKGIGGFRSWHQTPQHSKGFWRDDPGVLTGAAGVGLSLLAAISEVEPTWDRLLLASIPVRCASEEPSLNPFR